ncbi:hypothetical protein SRABI04_02992 [Chryseobacterium sp. Bi04]|nr:hypothetical protein SRABI04_02992 [Chryseobacterium sp. Bi04]
MLKLFFLTNIKKKLNIFLPKILTIIIIDIIYVNSRQSNNIKHCKQTTYT